MITGRWLNVYACRVWSLYFCSFHWWIVLSFSQSYVLTAYASTGAFRCQTQRQNQLDGLKICLCESDSEGSLSTLEQTAVFHSTYLPAKQDWWWYMCGTVCVWALQVLYISTVCFQMQSVHVYVCVHVHVSLAQNWVAPLWQKAVCGMKDKQPMHTHFKQTHTSTLLEPWGRMPKNWRNVTPWPCLADFHMETGHRDGLHRKRPE